MNTSKWYKIFGISLIVISAAVYFIHYLVFHDIHHIFIYFLGDIAFVPIEVLMVTLILHQLLTYMEKRNMLEKLNMVIGVFFSEIGTKFLCFLSDFDPDLDAVRNELVVTNDWNDEDFLYTKKRLKNYNYSVDIRNIDLVKLRTLLGENRNILVRLLENPTLLEHESFTELLRAVFHLLEELVARGDLEDLPDTDLDHISGDIGRVYGLLVDEWLDYMQHLKNNYPYLFSLSMRTNPFDTSASPVVK
ncbi:MAG: hypothetical protein P1P69_01765 [Methanosarcinaceae archaeon]|nr:hypothetical protein [Methanosarcinaceae archaeon]MDF1533215.1 hypothetical protein [Methanosarcinaceae archaeon]